MKIFFKALALVLVAILAFSMVSCEKQFYSEEFVLEEFKNIVTKIQNHKHIHTEDVLPGMTEEEFAPVEEAIHAAIHDGGEYTIFNNGVEDYIDDDGNHVYVTEYALTCGPNVVNIIVVYCDGHDTIYRIDFAI